MSIIFHINNIKQELQKNSSFRAKLCLLCYRMGFLETHICKKKLQKIMFRFLYIIFKFLCFLLSCGDIPPKKSYIDYGIRIPHSFQGIFINENVKIGKNATLFQNTTLGAIEGHNYKANIIIGDNVYIGCGCIILGNTQIGSNVKIGAGTKIINEIIPDNVTVVNKTELKIILNKKCSL